MLANTAGVKKRTFCVLLIDLLSTTWTGMKGELPFWQRSKAFTFYELQSELTLDFKVDRIRLTMDNLSSFRPVLRISGKNSGTNQTQWSSTHHWKYNDIKYKIYFEKIIRTGTFDFQYLSYSRAISWHQEWEHKLDKSHAHIRFALGGTKVLAP